jgi:hypothetical protein
MLNCLAVSCPRLVAMGVPYQSYDSFAVERASEFFNAADHCSVDLEKERVSFSKLLDWYKEDFLLSSSSLIEYANRYRTEKIPASFKVKYLDYDWDLNNRD